MRCAAGQKIKEFGVGLWREKQVLNRPSMTLVLMNECLHNTTPKQASKQASQPASQQASKDGTKERTRTKAKEAWRKELMTNCELNDQSDENS